MTARLAKRVGPIPPEHDCERGKLFRALAALQPGEVIELRGFTCSTHAMASMALSRARTLGKRVATRKVDGGLNVYAVDTV